MTHSANFADARRKLSNTLNSLGLNASTVTTNADGRTGGIEMSVVQTCSLLDQASRVVTERGMTASAGPKKVNPRPALATIVDRYNARSGHGAGSSEIEMAKRQRQTLREIVDKANSSAR